MAVERITGAIATLIAVLAVGVPITVGVLKGPYRTMGGFAALYFWFKNARREAHPDSWWARWFYSAERRAAAAAADPASQHRPGRIRVVAAVCITLVPAIVLPGAVALGAAEKGRWPWLVPAVSAVGGILALIAGRRRVR